MSETSYVASPTTLRMKEMPQTMQPREMFDRLGPENMPDQALLALIVRTGTQGVNVADLTDRMLRQYGSLTRLAQAPMEELMGIKGMGRVKAQMIKAALELARRMALESIPDQPCIASPEDAVMLLRERARTAEEEIFWVLILDTKNRLKGPPIEVSRGTLNASLAHPREVFKQAIRASAASVVLLHNHPSGDPSPSAEDLRVTRQLVEAGKIIEINVLDHIVIGARRNPDRPDFISLREAGLVSFQG